MSDQPPDPVIECLPGTFRLFQRVLPASLRKVA
jgi:hypothetical protein